MTHGLVRGSSKVQDSFHDDVGRRGTAKGPVIRPPWVGPRRPGRSALRTRKGSDALFLRLEQAGADPVQSREWVDRAGTTTEARRTGAHDPGPVRLGQPVAGRRAARRPDPDQEPEPEGQGRPGQRYPDRAVHVLRARPASPIDGRDNAHRDRVRGERGREESEESVEEMGTIARPISFGGADQAAGRDGLAPGRGGSVGVGGGHGHGQFPRGAAGRSVGPLAGRAGRDSAGRATGALVREGRGRATSRRLVERLLRGDGPHRGRADWPGPWAGPVAQDCDWKVEAGYPSDAHEKFVYSKTILERICKERRTFYRLLGPYNTTESLCGGDRRGGLAGLQRRGDRGHRRGLRREAPRHQDGRAHGEDGRDFPLEAQLVQVLAAAVGAGLARRESELEARDAPSSSSSSSRPSWRASSTATPACSRAATGRSRSWSATSAASPPLRASRPARDLPADEST